jgi:hypothetical protein
MRNKKGQPIGRKNRTGGKAAAQITLYDSNGFWREQSEKSVKIN